MSDSPPGVWFLRIFARTWLALVTLFWLCFAATSGAEPGLEGLVANLHNAWPWMGLLVLLFVAFRWEFVGGALVVAAGLWTVVFFNAWTQPLVLFIISVPIIAAGSAFMLCHILDTSKRPA